LKRRCLSDRWPSRSGSLFLAGRRRAYPAVCQQHAHGRTCGHVRDHVYSHVTPGLTCNLCWPAEIAADRYQQQQTLRASCIRFCFTIGIPVRTFRQRCCIPEGAAQQQGEEEGCPPAVHHVHHKSVQPSPNTRRLVLQVPPLLSMVALALWHKSVGVARETRARNAARSSL